MELEHIITTPLGNLAISGDNHTIRTVLYTKKEVNLEENVPKEVSRCINQLQEYFANKRQIFELNLQPEGTTFQKRVWQMLLKIPYGKTWSYEKLAIELGDIKAIRAAGTANGKNPMPVIIPCHRVIGKNGSLIGYSGGMDKKKWLLKHEHIINEQMGIFN